MSSNPFGDFESLTDQQLQETQSRYRTMLSHAEANSLQHMADSARIALSVIEEIVTLREHHSLQQLQAKENKKKHKDSNVLYTFGEINKDDPEDLHDFKY